MIFCKKMVGVAGFEPAHGDIKNRCLTAWLHPNNVLFCRSPLLAIKRKSSASQGKHLIVYRLTFPRFRFFIFSSKTTAFRISAEASIIDITINRIILTFKLQNLCDINFFLNSNPYSEGCRILKGFHEKAN